MKKLISYTVIALIAFVGGWLLRPERVVVEHVVKEVERRVEVPVPTPPVTVIKTRVVEKEPTPHPTDCVVMKWLDD